MWIISNLFKKKRVHRATISFIGPSMAGKTTLIRYLETGKPVLEDVHTTLGMNLRNNTVKIGGWEISIIDTGGQQEYQQLFWELAIHQADAIILIIDATIRPTTDPVSFDIIREQIRYALDLVAEEQPLLFLLNKQDLQGQHPMSVEECIQLFELFNIINKKVEIRAISAKYGDGVISAIEWLVDQLSEE